MPSASLAAGDHAVVRPRGGLGRPAGQGARQGRPRPGVVHALERVHDRAAGAIRSGLAATIAYEIELRRAGTLWFDRTIATATVTATARYDNLTRQHQLSRTVDGRGEEPRLTEDEAQVREWMTVFKQLPVFDTRQLEANAEYCVRVRARTRPRVNWLLFWPWEHGARPARPVSP